MLEFTQIGNRSICLRGIGKMFYQEGLPIGISIKQLLSKGYEISLLHIADELLKNGWSPERVILTLTTELQDSVADGVNIFVDYAAISSFCFKEYEDQREMIFKYLFGNKESGVEWLKNKFDSYG